MRRAALLTAATLGRTVSAVDLGPFSVLEVDYATKSCFPRHAHERSYACILLRGEFEERVGARRHAVASAGVVLMPAGVEHAETFGPMGGHSVVVSMPPTYPGPAISGPLVFRGGPVSRTALALCRTLRFAGEQGAFASEEHLLALLAAAAPGDEPPADDSRVDRAREALADRFAESLRLGALAHEVGCDPAYLARAFRRRFGCTMSAWLRRCRVEAAAHRLADSTRPLAEVAADCGFADQSHFSRVFKAETGLTPRAFRRLTGA